MTPLVLNGQALVKRIVEDGDVPAGVELARKMKYRTVSQLLKAVCPKGDPPPAVFDAVADAMAFLLDKEKAA